MEEGSWHCCHSLLRLQRLCACFLAPQSPCLTDLSLCLHFYELLGEAGGAERQQYIPVQRGDIVPRTGNKGGSVLSEFTAGFHQRSPSKFCLLSASHCPELRPGHSNSDTAIVSHRPALCCLGMLLLLPSACLGKDAHPNAHPSGAGTGASP